MTTPTATRKKSYSNLTHGTEESARNDFIFHADANIVFMGLIHAKQFLKRAPNDALNDYISSAVQRIQVPHRAEKAQVCLEESNAFIDGKLPQIDEQDRNEICNRMAAVSLLSVRQAVKKGTVGDLGIDWEVVKGMFEDELHREILDDESDARYQGATSYAGGITEDRTLVAVGNGNGN